jgi:DNA-binding transcriptional regulator YiaG
MQGYSIYRLIDPRDNTTRYIGLTIDPDARLKGHVSDKKRNGKRSAWVKELGMLNLQPKMEILETVIEGENAEATALKRELYWIHEYFEAGSDLLNIAGMLGAHTPTIKRKKQPTRQQIAKQGRTTNLKLIREQLREGLGLSQEGLARRTRSISARTIRNAEAGQRVTFETARQILRAINEIYSEVGRAAITIDDLGLNLGYDEFHYN